MSIHISTLLLLVAAGTVHPFSSCNRGKWNHARNMFNSISNDVINHDHDMKETCKHFKQFAMREVFGINAFKIEIYLPGFDSAAWNLMIRHRVIYINAHYPRTGKDCDLTYVDVRVLPSIANTHASAWMYANGMLVVAFPYKYDMSSHALSCSQDIDETLINVRRGFPTERIFV